MRFTEKSVSSLPVKDKPYTIREKGSKGFMVRVLPTGTKTFYFERTYQGKKRKARLGVFFAVSVQDVRSKYYVLLSTPEEILIEEQRGNELLSPLAQRFLKAKKPVVKSGKTLSDYKQYIQLFIEKHGGEGSALVAHLTALNVQKLHVYITEDEMKPTKENRVKQALSSFSTWLVIPPYLTAF